MRRHLAAAAVGAVVGAVVGVLGAGVLLADAGHVGSWAEWIGGAGTIGAVLFAGRQLQHDVAVRREDLRRFARDEARKMLLVCKLEVQEADRDGVAMYHLGRIASVQNTSSDIVEDVDLLLEFGGIELGRWHEDELIPGRALRQDFQHEWPLDKAPTGRDWNAVATWRDVERRYWRRDLSNRLEEIAPPA